MCLGRGRGEGGRGNISSHIAKLRLDEVALFLTIKSTMLLNTAGHCVYASGGQKTHFVFWILLGCIIY